MRSPIRRRRNATPATAVPPALSASSAPAAPAVLLLAAGLLIAGCGGPGGGDRGRAETSGAAVVDPRGVRLQPAGAPVPHPFTASTVRSSPGGPAAPPRQAGEGRGPVTVPGSTPGLYGGTPSAPSCDVERQAGLLTADDARAEAFAKAAGIGRAGIASWLRDLTPVVLRADTRVTGHGYRDGSAVPYPAVLQAGTAVLVDQYGAPRVRCGCGGPLRSPGLAGSADGADAAAGAAAGRTAPWAGYHPGRVVIVTPTQQVVHSLIIVDLRNNTWLERLTGTGAARDRRPEAPPPYAPGERDLAAAA
ncbi:DUF6777 domain-containing protein, partial [Streptomyces gobitricini]